ncbi:leucyl aminopeptidase [Flavobacterium branchiophilum]|uniref:Leucyl aminopeptidase n=1 Tax=Flavobacterium branchiophilum TaxID=55197 RepID=A0A543G836_9FLAO|nr:leucyl aminopeptidase family protein [Flavobacterium branchiophilum]OXA76897.1 leucyl aminopeptidase [Flavobacterium branchiophilum] [Flavobacterium branchiophilum NBRC 15030 = ATCC 35035]TQM42242.1 leucyl aminopeptidase [Flavobacterium branchiophilum]GEM54304.1 putative cytosol aminopeptidase [Flavobacterium branchiophilum NBRC 15030 = ATCC 35035]
MKTSIINPIDQNFEGTIIMPFFEVSEEQHIVYQDIKVNKKLFSGKKDTQYCIETPQNIVLLVGVGVGQEYDSLRKIFRNVSRKNKTLFEEKTLLVLPDSMNDNQIEAILIGLYWGTYDLGFYKNNPLHPFLEPSFVLNINAKNANTSVIEKSIKIAKAQIDTMKLVDLPPNVVTPKYLTQHVQELSDKVGFTTTVLGFDACKTAGLEAFLSVGKGSQHEPQFIIMEYVPKTFSKKTKHIGLVGKGITFDTGGLNIKTAAMVQMKTDMAGGAAVIGAMQLIADLGLDVCVTAIVPACENAVDAKSFLPSDIINSYSGHTIEIVDTDAEGRLILADGLSYLIQNYKPEIIIDLATLTGSCIGTFGFETAALFSNNKEILANLQEIGQSINEKLWPLPLWDCYQSDIESEFADVKNYSGKPFAGAISAAKFLEFFTEKHPAWAHIDIAGVSFVDDEFAKTKHATAFGVQLLLNFIEKTIENANS